MNWKQLYFGFEGRVSRGTFCAVSLSILIPISAVLGLTLGLVIGKNASNHTLLDWIFNPFAFIAFICFLELLLLPITIKRMHDLNWSGRFWVLFLLIVAFCHLAVPLGFVDAPSQIGRLRLTEKPSDIYQYTMIAQHICSVFMWIFGFMQYFVPGTSGPNKYGPDPLANKNESPLKSNQPKLF